jgi:hypothetical protein
MGALDGGVANMDGKDIHHITDKHFSQTIRDDSSVKYEAILTILYFSQYKGQTPPARILLAPTEFPLPYSLYPDNECQLRRPVLFRTPRTGGRVGIV